MKIVILGAGVIGVTTAYALAKNGYDVEVIDRSPQAAAECSFANGGQLSYSHAEPWATPGTLTKVAKWLFDDSAPLIMRPRLDYQMLKWGLKFIGNCTRNKSKANTKTLLQLGLYSRDKMAEIIEDTNIEFSHTRDGILHIFTKQSDFDCAKRQLDYQSKFGCNESIITTADAVKIEPNLKYSNENIIGAVHAKNDEGGDTRIFTKELARICTEQYGVKFHYDTNIIGIDKNNNEITAITTNKGDITADKYVMSLGAYSPLLLREIGISVPIYPMKGYSLTVNNNDYTPKISITDQRHKIVYSKVGDKLRIAGTAEFAGYNNSIKKQRIDNLRNAIDRVFPKALENNNDILEWSCLRPSTPDGPPIIGKTPYDNLFLNTGHGTLGWTQAAGSAFLLADTIMGKETEINLSKIEIDRFL